MVPPKTRGLCAPGSAGRNTEVSVCDEDALSAPEGIIAGPDAQAVMP